MDCYVFEFATGRYQVRDKVAFDNVYQEFTSLDGLLGHIISLIKQHCWTNRFKNAHATTGWHSQLHQLPSESAESWVRL